MPGYTPISADDAWSKRDDDRYDDLRDALEERARSRRGALGACRCGNDLPGRCPGPDNCPMCDDDQEPELGEVLEES